MHHHSGCFCPHDTTVVAVLKSAVFYKNKKSIALLFNSFICFRVS